MARTAALALIAVALIGGGAVVQVEEVSANHQVFVEGNCDNVTMVPPGTCGDYDGDGRIGAAEDTDGPDRIFGTITAALGPGMFGMTATGANQNGRVLIVTSGRFPETVTITAANGNVILEAAPGVDANIEAVVQGVDGNTERQAAPGIIVNAPANRYVVIRNIASRNWTAGILVQGGSRVTIDNGRMDSNIGYGIQMMDDARVVIVNSQIQASGIRANPMAASNAPSPGAGIGFAGRSSGVVAFTTVSGSVSAGIQSTTGNPQAVSLQNVVLFDNNPDTVGL